jgi:hypothetical protein
MTWLLSLHGGTFDRYRGQTDEEPPPVVIAWAAASDTRMTSDPANPNIDLRSAESYRRVAVSRERCHAAYEVGEDEPRPEQLAQELAWLASRIRSVESGPRP